MKIIKTSKYKDRLKGGLGDRKTPKDFNDIDVEIGKSVEFEHTNDPGTAKEIAIDHLGEHKDYYNDKKGLPAMEKKLEKKKPARHGRYRGGVQRRNVMQL